MSAPATPRAEPPYDRPAGSASSPERPATPRAEPPARVPWATLAAGAIIAGAWVVAAARGVDPWRPSPTALVDLGGSGGPGATAVWRILTAWTVHAGALHLAFDLGLLGLVGPALERRVGAARLAVAVVGGAAAAAAISRWHSPYTLSVGASGAAFAVAAALAVRIVRERGGRPGQTPGPSARSSGGSGCAVVGSRRALAGLAAFVVANAVAAAVAPSIDHAAHLGGALAGIAVGLVGAPYAAIAAAGLAALALALADPPAASLRAAVTAIDAIERRYEALLDAPQDAAVARAIRSEILGPLAAVTARLPDDPRCRVCAAARRYVAARGTSLELYARYLETGDTRLRDEIVQAEHAVRAALEDLRAP